MKKGCFLTIITVVTIIVMAGIYFYKSNKELFQNFGRDKIISLATDEINEKIKKLQPTPYKDSLLTVLREEAKNIKKENFEMAMNQFGFIADKIKLVINDGILDSLEFAEVKELVKSYERSKKN